MPDWQEEKRSAQTAFTFAGNLFQDIHSSIGNVYQQILMTGHPYPPTAGRDSLTHQITEDIFRDAEQDIGLAGHQHTYEPRNDPDQGIEPGA